MITPCNGENGCGTVMRNNMTEPFNNHTTMANQTSISYPEMTNVTAQIPATTNVPTGSGYVASTFPMPGTTGDVNVGTNVPPSVNMTENIAGQPDPPMGANVGGGTSTTVTPENNILPESPHFTVPNNPLLPPGYQEILNYENLQYLNGFLRTQIGKYVRVEQLIGPSTIEDRFGYLVGVGINYILLQQLGSGNISALDYYNIKYIYFYTNTTGLPTGD